MKSRLLALALLVVFVTVESVCAATSMNWASVRPTGRRTSRTSFTRPRLPL